MSAPVARGAQLLVAVATVVVLLAIGIAPFATPLWMYPVQDRADAEGWTGWPAEQVHDVSGSALYDVLVGPPDFAQVVDGQPVFDAAEASHLRDVHRLALEFYATVTLAALVLIAAWLALRDGRFWPAVRTGAGALGIGVVVLGLVAAVAFEPAFDLAHRLFFAAGTYSFDPSTSRMVQLFPEAYWFQTAIALGVWLIVLALLARRIAGARIAAARARADPSRTAHTGDGGAAIGRESGR